MNFEVYKIRAKRIKISKFVIEKSFFKSKTLKKYKYVFKIIENKGVFSGARASLIFKAPAPEKR